MRAEPQPRWIGYARLAVHQGQCVQNSRKTPQPHLPHVSLLPAIFHAFRTLVRHQGQ